MMMHNVRKLTTLLIYNRHELLDIIEIIPFQIPCPITQVKTVTIKNEVEPSTSADTNCSTSHLMY
jgi:hypothetical protein